MLAPQLASGVNVLISSPDHIGTSVPVMVVWLILDHARPRWYIPVIAAVLLGWAEVADTLVLYIGVLPLALVCAVRVYRAVAVERRPLTSQLYDMALGVAGLAGAAAAALALHAIHAHGGFFSPHPITQFAQGGTLLPRNLGITAEGLLLLGGADFLGLRLAAGAAFTMLHMAGVFLAAWGTWLAARRFLRDRDLVAQLLVTAIVINLAAGAAFTMLHMAGVFLAAWGTWLAARRFLRDRDLVAQLLVTAIVINLAAYVLSTQADSVTGTREIAAVLPLSAVLAGRLLAGRLMTARLVPLLLVVLLGYLAGLAHEIGQPPVPAQNQQLTSWLAARHLHAGLSGYWESNVVTLTSGERVQIRQVAPAGGMLTPSTVESDAAWYDPDRNTASFVVLFPGVPGSGYTGFTGARAVLATFGKPARIYHIGSYIVLVWHKNLLSELR